MFNQFKHAQAAYQNAMLREPVLYRTEVSYEQLWDTYLGAFPEEERQDHNCSCCRHFLRDAGALIAFRLVDGKVERSTMWDFEVQGVYAPVVAALRDLVANAPIKDVYFTKYSQAGCERTFSEKHDRYFEHLHCTIPRHHRGQGSDLSTMRGRVQVMRRMLDEWTVQPVDDILALIEDNNLYKGDEHKSALLAIREHLNVGKETPNYAWYAAPRMGAIASLRNSLIGTLISDLVEGVPLEDAVKKYESKAAPHNYMRKKAVMTQSQLNKIRDEFTQAGYMGSLNREFATTIPLNKYIYTQRGTFKATTNLLDEVETELTIDPRRYKDVPPISLQEFLQALPAISGLEMLVENKHAANFMSLIDGPEPTLFKWPNTVAWSYTGALTSSDLKQRVKAAGGKVDNVVFRASLGWKGSHTDLDLHLEWGGRHIYYGNARQNIEGGTLDVDMNAGAHMSYDAVENIVFPYVLPKGKFKLYCNTFSVKDGVNNGCTIEIEYNGSVYEFHQLQFPKDQENWVIEFEHDGHKLIFNQSVQAKSSKGIQKWSVTTNRWFVVDGILPSPNHWEEPTVGTRHLFFLNKEIKNDEATRGFFNEFLLHEITQKFGAAMEYLGGKAIVPYSDQQLSGIGFNTTEAGQNIVIRYVEGGKQQTRLLTF